MDKPPAATSWNQAAGFLLDEVAYTSDGIAQLARGRPVMEG